MNKVQASTITISLAFLLAACSSSDTNSQGSGGTNPSAGGKTSTGPVGGTTATGGAGGSLTGPSGGTTVSTNGGSTVGPVGGNTGAQGGNTGAQGGNTGAQGGNTGAQGGNTGAKGGNTGAQGGNTGAQGGNTGAKGGNTGAQGGSAGAAGAKGGTTSTGGVTTSVGGTATGGTPAAGGVTASAPKLITSAANAYWQVGTVTEVTSGTADVTVNDGTALQNWTGFGGTFNEKGWEALAALSQADRDKAIKLLYDGVDGAKFMYGRIPIGASDYATNRYTLDDTAGDTAMTSFSIARDRDKLIPFIKAAIAVKSDIHFWGSPWTPPPWMKDNNAYDRGNMKDDATNLAAYAVYLSKFVEEYGKEGIKIEAIHPQNEPGYPQDYPSCLWTGALMAKFIGTHLGPTFKTRNITADIFIGTMSNKDTDGTVLTTVMNDATAKTFIKGYGLQWGMLDTYASLGMNKSLPIWQTEHKCGNYPWVTGTDQSKAPNDMAYAQESWGLIRDWIKAGVNTYSAWNMVLDTVGRSLDTVRPWAQNALLAVDVAGKKLNITPTYYVFRHLSQYVDSGAKVVSTTGGDALAFKNPSGSIVTVMYNSGSAKTAIVAVGGKKLQFSMPASGWATINSQ